MTAPISNEPTTTRLHHYAGHYYIAARKHAPKNGECAVKIARLALEHGGEFLWWGEETFDTQNDDGGRNLQGNIYWQQDGEMKTRAYTCDVDSAGLLKRSSWLGDK